VAREGTDQIRKKQIPSARKRRTQKARPTALFPPKNPLSPLFPLHPRNAPVTPLFPLLTQKQGGGGVLS
jgi:hypothetical protein